MADGPEVKGQPALSPLTHRARHSQFVGGDGRKSGGKLQRQSEVSSDDVTVVRAGGAGLAEGRGGGASLSQTQGVQGVLRCSLVTTRGRRRAIPELRGGACARKRNRTRLIADGSGGRFKERRVSHDIAVVVLMGEVVVAVVVVTAFAR